MLLLLRLVQASFNYSSLGLHLILGPGLRGHSPKRPARILHPADSWRGRSRPRLLVHSRPSSQRAGQGSQPIRPQLPPQIPKPRRRLRRHGLLLPRHRRFDPHPRRLKPRPRRLQRALARPAHPLPKVLEERLHHGDAAADDAQVHLDGRPDPHLEAVPRHVVGAVQDLDDLVGAEGSCQHDKGAEREDDEETGLLPFAELESEERG